jgi:RNA recognition motif-containing protein
VNIYVGNLAYSTSEEDLRTAFSQFGDIAEVTLIKDRMTGQSKGFGFVEMPKNAEADAAIKGLNQKPLGGRTITVNQAKPRTDSRPSRGGGGGGRY